MLYKPGDTVPVSRWFSKGAFSISLVHFSLRKIRNWRTRPADTRGGSPPGRGVENARQDPGYPFCGFFSKTNFFEKICSTMTPPLDPPLDPPHGPPIFFKFFFQFWTTGAPFYIFFFYYITVFPFIFSLFLFTFFSIIEGRAVVLQPPQLFFLKYFVFLLLRFFLLSCFFTSTVARRRLRFCSEKDLCFCKKRFYTHFTPFLRSPNLP